MNDEILVKLDELKAGQDGLRQDVNELKAGQVELKAGQEGLRQDVDGLKTGQVELKAGQEGLRQDVRLLRAGQGRLRDDMKEMRQHVDSVHRDLLEAIGESHEKVTEATQALATVVQDLRSRVEILERKAS
jgi:outer membrane murein-binding lipoprotein Lpp